MKSAVLALVLVAALTAGCDEQVDTGVPPPTDEVVTAPPSYDESRPPAAAVMALVSEDATTLAVTDFDQARLVLGFSELTSASPRAERDDFWRRAATTAPLLSPGRLRAQDARLEQRFGFTQDDVLWEADFSTPDGAGWVLRFRDDLPLTGVEAAVAAAVPGLVDGVVDAERHLVSSAATDDPETSWAADADRLALVGPLATATYVTTACVPFATAFGADVEDDLAPAPAAALGELDPVAAFSVSFGGSLATARLGAQRGDAFERARIADVLPQTDPEFGLGYADAVADPAGGRIGYRIGDAALAARLAVEQRLPFAVCSP